jgi:hypothetical protein
MSFGYIGDLTKINQIKKNQGVIDLEESFDLESSGHLGGSLKLIASQSITSSTAQVDFTSIKEDVFDVHLLTYQNYTPAVDGARLIMQFFESGTLESSAVYHFAGDQLRSNGSTNQLKSTGNAHIRMGVNVTDSDTNQSNNGYTYIYSAGNSNKYTLTTGHHTGQYYGDGTHTTEYGGAVLPQASTVDGFRLTSFSSGNIEKLEVKLFGLKQ